MLRVAGFLYNTGFGCSRYPGLGSLMMSVLLIFFAMDSLTRRLRCGGYFQPATK
jgi:hypothetical protein